MNEENLNKPQVAIDLYAGLPDPLDLRTHVLVPKKERIELSFSMAQTQDTPLAPIEPVTPVPVISRERPALPMEGEI